MTWHHICTTKRNLNHEMTHLFFTWNGEVLCPHPPIECEKKLVPSTMSDSSYWSLLKWSQCFYSFSFGIFKCLSFMAYVNKTLIKYLRPHVGYHFSNLPRIIPSWLTKHAPTCITKYETRIGSESSGKFAKQPHQMQNHAFQNINKNLLQYFCSQTL
jgi:hypothetical protein